MNKLNSRLQTQIHANTSKNVKENNIKNPKQITNAQVNPFAMFVDLKGQI